MVKMMSHTGTQLRAAAYDEPHDPTVATIYADSLDDNDRSDEAALVRRDAVSDCCQGSVEAFLLRDFDRERRAHTRIRSELPPPQGCGYDFRFGLPVAVVSSISTFQQVANELHAAGISWVRIKTRRGLRSLRDGGELANVRLFDLSGCRLSAEEIQVLAECPHLQNLRWLGLARTGITLNGVRALLQSSYLQGLRGIDLEGNDLKGSTGFALAEARDHPGLEVMELGRNDLDARSTWSITGACHAGKVTRLRLDGNPLGDWGVEDLARSKGMTHLRSLDLARCGITTDGAMALAESPHLSGVSQLNLADNPIGPRGQQLLRDRFGDRVLLF